MTQCNAAHAAGASSRAGCQAFSWGFFVGARVTGEESSQARTATLAGNRGFTRCNVPPQRRGPGAGGGGPKTHKIETGDGTTMRLLRSVHWVILALLLILAIPTASQAQVAVGISIHVGPPALPVYVQPVIPGPGYLWTPGYWAYGPDGYFWVPGTWVQPPVVGLLWTPGYWGWAGGAYLWHGGYWGPHVGFYGGINYGFGYGGVGFAGGYWRGGVFHYNTAVTNVNTTVIHNTYVNKTVINNNTTVNRTSFNGGTGGVTAQPTAAERAAENEHHTPATSLQTQHEQ